MIDINHNPTSREIRVFGLLWLLFLGAVGALAIARPRGLVGAATILATAWLVSLAFNPVHRRSQLAGVAMPLLFGLTGGAVLAGASPWTVAGVVWGLALSGASLIWIAPVSGRTLYVGWMFAALPVGWTISHLVLAAVYYLVLTPLGIVMRLVGRDPMQRAFDRSADSYCIERDNESVAGRHFRQY